MTNKKRVYIAGPMRGIPYFNFMAFDSARDSLKALGYIPVSPADLDREMGVNPFDLPKDYDWQDLDVIGFNLEEAIERDVKAIATCDAIYMLDGWQHSRGASAEKALAVWQGMEVIYQTDEPAVESNQTEFDTGAVRSAERAGQRYDLISPIGLRRLAETCHEGAVKYNDFNWEKGMPIHDILNHAIDHIYTFLSGNRDEDHLAHAAWNCFAAMHSQELWPELNEGTLRTEGFTPPK